MKVTDDLGLLSPAFPLCLALPRALSSIPRGQRLSPSLLDFRDSSPGFLLTSQAALLQSPLHLSLPDLQGPILLFPDDLTQVRDFKYHFCADGSQIYISVPTSPLRTRHIDLT